MSAATILPDERIRTMHILSSLDRRGAETFALLLADRLSRERFQPAIWTIRPPGVSAQAPSRTPVLSGRGRRRHPAAYHALRDLVRAQHTYRPHIIHCHGGRALKYVMLARSFTRPTALVYTKIGSVHPWLDHPVRRWFYGSLFERTNAIVTVGELVKREMEESFRLRRPQLLTIYTGRDITPFADVTPDLVRKTRAELGLDSHHLCLMSVGSLSWEKDPQLLLSLFAGLASADPRLRLVFVGEGPLRGELQRQATAAGLASSVRFLGSRPDVPALLSAADLFGLTSATEGLPGVLIEAGMAGKPAVAFGVGAVGEVLLDGQTGFVVPPGDGEAFKGRVLALAADVELRDRMGARARDFCQREFDIRRSVQRHEALFQSLLVPAPGTHPQEQSSAERA